MMRDSRNDGARPCGGPDATNQIAQLNDQLRRNLRGGQVFITQGLCALPKGTLPIILQAVSSYDAFSPDNDPHGERDFGLLSIEGRQILWKIDYYDRDMQLASPDPADPSLTTRVLTIMLAAEY